MKNTVAQLRPLVAIIHRQDRSLADQIRRSASSVALNLAEAAHNTQGHRRSRFESARGSASETRAALRVAVAWGYLAASQTEAVDADYDRIMAITYRLWRRA